MGRFLLFLARLLAVTAGFVFACAVAACCNLLLNSMLVPDGLAHLEARGVDLRLVIGLVGLASLFGHAAFVPSVVMILIGEFAKLRGPLVYSIGGGVIAGIVLELARRAGVAVSLDPRHVAIDLVCGLIGGFGYWLIAGHNAGCWLPSQLAASRRPRRPEA